MRSPIEYKLIPKDSAEFLELADFAETFDHKVVDHPQINVYGHYKDNRLVGYSDHVFIPTIYPAFHPDFTTPRDVIQTMHDWRVYNQLTGGPGYVGVPLQSERFTFTNEIMEKLGMKRLNREVFYIKRKE
jgi:hypothetical protein